MYRHVVMFQFNEAASAQAVSSVVEAFLGLKSQLPAIQTLEFGNNLNPEGLDQGFTHCFLLTFANQADFLGAYLNEPAHLAFTAKLEGLVERALVFDFELPDSAAQG